MLLTYTVIAMIVSLFIGAINTSAELGLAILDDKSDAFIEFMVGCHYLGHERAVL